MATYLLVNLVFLLAVLAAYRIRPRKPSKAWLLTLAGLLVMTAVFDSLIVGFGIVGYDTDKILGVYIGNAPIEDFFYAVLAVILVPTVWKLMEKRHDGKN